MIVIDLIKKEENKFTYYYFFHNQITVNVFEGFPAQFLDHFKRNQNQLIIEMVQDLLLIENELQHHAKTFQSYIQLVDNLKNFIKWGIENESMAEKVSTFIQLKIVDTLNNLLNLIDDNVVEKKDLLFIVHCVTKNSNHRIEVYE